MLGTQPLVQFKRGDHVCLFYRDESKLLETLSAYIAAGLQKNERCFCAQDQNVVVKLLARLQGMGIGTEDAVASGALEIHTVDEVYFTAGEFQPKAMLEKLERSIDDALARGFTGFRTAGEMSWALSDSEGQRSRTCDQLVEYEQMVESFYPGKSAVAMCQYPAHRFPRKVVDGLLDSHRISLEETMVSTNYSTLTVRSGDYVADIVADRLNPSAAFHYVVQKRGAKDVLSWGVEPTIDEALLSSEGVLASLQTKPSSRITEQA